MSPAASPSNTQDIAVALARVETEVASIRSLLEDFKSEMATKSELGRLADRVGNLEQTRDGLGKWVAGIITALVVSGLLWGGGVILTADRMAQAAIQAQMNAKK